jgi:Uma2 family endonuclease
MSTNLHLSVTEYDRMVQRGAFDHLNRKIELIYGEIREMNPAGPVHDDLIAYLIDWSVHTIDREKIRVTVQSGLDLSDLKSRPEPDLLWVRAARYRDRHPTAADVKLAIEVSDSSLQADLIEKAALYAQAGIVEYWIVDAKGQCVHVFRDPQAGEYTQRSISKIGEFLSPLEPCNHPLDLHDLFV